jgi:tungstate transport system substrate-binding protein
MGLTIRWYHPAVLGLALMAAAAVPAMAQQPSIVMASTTSTEQSGLFKFRQATGIEVRVVAVGTGQALDAGRRGDADVVFVHDTVAEEKFVAEGFALRRQAVMYNDFVLVGPAADPAKVKGSSIVAGLQRLVKHPSPFISRGDNSGTHAAELRLWANAGLDIATARPAGYRECGCGMGPALNMASSINGYGLTDRGTWLSFRNKGDLAVLVEGDKSLFNQYGVMVVNPAKHPHVRQAQAQTFADWVVSAAGQEAIAGYRIEGQPLFFPNAGQGN